MKPNGEASMPMRVMGNRASDDQIAATVSLSKNCFLVILPATARNLREPPGADPHAGWCGGRGEIPPATRLALNFYLDTYRNQLYIILYNKR
jgi:hypothetical protein